MGAAARAADASADGNDGAALDVGADADALPEAPAPVSAPHLPPPVPLRVRVLAKGTRQPLASVAVTLDAAPAGETDANGRVELLVAPGPYHLQAQLPGYEVVERRVDAAAGAPEELLRLPPRQTGERYETTVRAAPTGAPRVELTGDEARQTAGTSGDPLRVLASLPGVSQVVWPAAIYVVRGANPGNTGFYLDGIRVPALFHLALGPSLIHPYLIGGLDFYPGGFPASFGGAVSGIVAARTTPAPADRVHALVDVTLYDAGGLATAPLDGGRGSVVAAARYSYTGALLSALNTGTALAYGDYQLRADHAMAGGQATVFAFGSLDRLGWDIAGTEDQYAALQFHRLDLRWSGPLAGGRLLVGVNGGVDWARSTLFTRAIKVRALSVMPRLLYDHSLGAAVDLRVGADAQAQRFETDVPMFQPRQSDLGRDRDAFSQAAFAALTVRAGRRLVASAGMRGDLFIEQDTHAFALEPRLDARVVLTEALALKLTAGRFAQMPSLPVNVSGFEAFGLADLGLQTSLAASAGVEASLPRALSVSVTGYAQRLRVTDVRNIDLTTPDPTAPDFLVSRLGRAMGVELLVRRADQGRLYGWLAYTLSWSLRRDDNGVLGRSDWDQRHLLNLVAGYRLRGGWSAGTRFHYATGRYAPIFDSGGQYRELPAFYQLDLRVDRRFVFDRFVLTAYLDIANATWTREVIQLRQAYDSMNQPYIFESSLQIALPTLGLHAEL